MPTVLHISLWNLHVEFWLKTQKKEIYILGFTDV